MTCAGGARGAGERATGARQPSRASGGHDEREAALVEVERRRRRTKGLVRGHDRGVRPRRARSSAASRNRAPAWVVATETTTSGWARSARTATRACRSTARRRLCRRRRRHRSRCARRGKRFTRRSYRHHYQWMREECQDGNAGLPLNCKATPMPTPTPTSQPMRTSRKKVYAT